MTKAPNRKPASEHRPGAFAIILFLITAAAAVPRLLLGRSQYIEYDGYWHIFIAQQDNWSRFWEDVGKNAHPPLFFLLLKAMLHVGHSFLVYRSISLVTGIGSVALVGWIARKITGSEIRAYQAALLYGFALPGIIMACEVRSYMLSTFFILLSFASLLDIHGTGGRPETKARAGFTGWAILACFSHYFAFFYSGAAMLILAVQWATRRFRGKESSWRAEAATILPLAASMVTLYVVHARKLAIIQDHLSSFYYLPHGPETVSAFLLRNSRSMLNLFAPWQISNDAAAIAVMILAIASGLFALLTTKGNGSRTIAITWIMLGAIILAAIAGKYPYGGDLRQQYLLFPFFVLCLAVVVEQVIAALPAAAPSWGRETINAVLVAAVVVAEVAQFAAHPKVTQPLFVSDVRTFDQMDPAPAAVYLDQFNLIAFFIYHDDWTWTLQPRHPRPDIDVYRVRKGDRAMLVFRDKDRWNVDPTETDFYPEMLDCLNQAKGAGITVFGIRQSPPKPPFDNLNRVRAGILKSAGESSFCAQRISLDPTDWFATFGKSDCLPPPPPPPAVNHEFDDRSEYVQYVGQWRHGSFPQAADGTTSESKDPGAVARLTFQGDHIVYVYTAAENRGIAQVKIDGASVGEVDLYSKDTIWQARTEYRNLNPGKHTFELVVTGKSNPRATDRYVDFDALLVP